LPAKYDAVANGSAVSPPLPSTFYDTAWRTKGLVWISLTKQTTKKLFCWQPAVSGKRK